MRFGPNLKAGAWQMVPSPAERELRARQARGTPVCSLSLVPSLCFFSLFLSLARALFLFLLPVSLALFLSLFPDMISLSPPSLSLFFLLFSLSLSLSRSPPLSFSLSPFLSLYLLLLTFPRSRQRERVDSTPAYPQKLIASCKELTGQRHPGTLPNSPPKIDSFMPGVDSALDRRG